MNNTPKRVVVIGDIMLDEYLFGFVNRTSSCLKLPIIEKVSSEYCLGGAANVASNLASLGQNVFLIGCCADDEAGKNIKTICQAHRIQLFDFPVDKTLIKQRIFIGEQQVVRIDTENKARPDPPEIIQLLDTLCADIIIMVDYGYGCITLGLADEVLNFCKTSHTKCIFHSRTLHKYKELHLPIIIANEAEFATISDQDFHDSELFITKAERGICHRNRSLNHDTEIHAKQKRAINTSGAGDCVTSVIALFYETELPIETLLTLANVAGEKAVMTTLTYSVTKADLILGYFDAMVSRDSSLKIVPRSLADLLTQAWISEGQKVRKILLNHHKLTTKMICEVSRLYTRSSKKALYLETVDLINRSEIPKIEILAMLDCFNLVVLPDKHPYFSIQK